MAINLWPLTVQPTSQCKIFGLDGYTHSMDSSKISIFKEGDKICLWESHHDRWLEMEIGLHRYHQWGQRAKMRLDIAWNLVRSHERVVRMGVSYIFEASGLVPDHHISHWAASTAWNILIVGWQISPNETESYCGTKPTLIRLELLSWG